MIKKKLYSQIRQQGIKAFKTSKTLCPYQAYLDMEYQLDLNLDWPTVKPMVNKIINPNVRGELIDYWKFILPIETIDIERT